jgi:hypothetical protein
MARFTGSRLRLGFGRFASVYDIARSHESAAIPLTGNPISILRAPCSMFSGGEVGPRLNTT